MDPLLQGAFATGYERLAAWADLLDKINVFPVADADTGRNLMISLAPLHRMNAGAETIVRKLLVSATGNSGNIASGFFAGFVAENPSKDICQATRVGRNRARQAIADPKPGTMLTVFDELLNHLENVSSIPLPATFPTLIDQLEKAVHSTSVTLPVLKAAGVVDSGALGMFIFMEGFFSRLAGRADVFRPITEIFGTKLRLPADFVAEPPKGYCVDTVVQVGRDCDSALENLSQYGNSLVALQENARFKIHLHTEQPDAVRKHLADLGRVVQWSEEDMGAHADKRSSSETQPVIHIVTDAAGSITREDAARLGMTLLDSYIIVGDRSLPETLFPPEELYALMRNGVKVTTSQASVFERHQRCQSILSRYGLALYLCVGSVYTGNYEVAAAWKERNDPQNRLAVIDTGLASGRLGVAALATARYAIQTDDAEQVIRFAAAAVRRSQEFIFLDRLQYLVAGGRLSRTKGFLGDLLHLKPVISPTAEGAVKAGTVRDKDEQLPFALEKLEKGVGRDPRPLIMIEYSDNRQWVEDNVLGEINSRYASAEIILQPLSLTSGAHMGPGTWAVAFLPAGSAPPQTLRPGPDSKECHHCPTQG